MGAQERETGDPRGYRRLFSDGFEDLDDHDGSCPYPCPICLGMAFLGQMRPEVAEHMFKAGRELMLAAKAFLDQVSEESSAPPVEKIPLDDEGP